MPDRDYVQSCLENLPVINRESIEDFLNTCPNILTETDGKKCYTIEENEHVLFIWYKYEADRHVLDGGNRIVIHK